jgi:hypothetical protein
MFCFKMYAICCGTTSLFFLLTISKTLSWIGYSGICVRILGAGIGTRIRAIGTRTRTRVVGTRTRTRGVGTRTRTRETPYLPSSAIETISYMIIQRLILKKEPREGLALNTSFQAKKKV